MNRLSSSVGSTPSPRTGGAAGAALAAASWVPVMSSWTLILNSLRVGSSRIDSAPVASARMSIVSWSPRRAPGSTASVNHRLNAWLRR